MSESIPVGRGETHLFLDLSTANRHGLIAGATGTGKTVSLRVLAEGFSRAGVPIFMADVKGDLAGMGFPGVDSPRFAERTKSLALGVWKPEAMPVIFWDLFGQQGHPVRTTISEMGPLLLSRLLGLNEVQEGVLNVIFSLADDEGLLLLDLKDLRAILTYVAGRAQELSHRYGAVAGQSVGAIQRALLTLENQGGEHFFGEPALELADLMQVTPDGRGAINILAADQLMQSPKLYSTFLLWLLSELFEQLPEVGDMEKPKLVFFFDEAHLLFNEAPKALVDKIEQVVRLIRSKGVGVYFVTQSPLDIPDQVLGQLGNRIQHALRAFTPRDQKAVRAAAETFRPNPRLDTAAALQELAVGEALVSLLDGKGVPGIVQRALIAPPASRLGTITPAERQEVVSFSPVAGKYDAEIDRQSAYEFLTERAAPSPTPARSGNPWGARSASQKAPSPFPMEDERPNRRPAEREAPSVGGEVAKAVFKSAARGLASSIGSSLGRQIVRGVLGAILKR
jgi:DNA helicase HerA-like ATPase